MSGLALEDSPTGTHGHASEFAETRLSWKYGAAALSVLMFVGLVALSYRLGMRDLARNAVPFVRAESTPSAAPAGNTAPAADLSAVYERRPDATVTPAPAAAVTPVVDTPKSGSSTVPLITGSGSASSPLPPLHTQAVQPVAPTVGDPLAAPTEAPVKNTTAPGLPAPKPRTVVHQAPKPAVAAPVRSVENIIAGINTGGKTSAAAAASGAAVQLASVRNRDEAERLADSLRQKYADALQGASLNVVRSEVAGRGVYYRIRAGYADLDTAKKACAALRGRGAACMLTATP